VLSHEPRFAIWQADASGVSYCGFSEWKDRETAVVRDVESFSHLYDQLEQVFVKESQPAELMDMSDLVTTVLTKAGRPLRFADLVTIINQLRRIEERSELTEDQIPPRSSLRAAGDVASSFEDKEFLKNLWQEIGLLPLRHRAALILNLKNDRGDGLITLLPLTRVATIEQIAGMLEFSLDEFARIWPELPWDDLTIADHFGITRQQVINLRQSARSTLRRRMNR
jgi:hypothetical protein